MRRHNWPAVAGSAGVAFAAEAFAGFGLWFAPGWANRWPGGPSIHLVWPAGLTAVAGAMLLTAAAGVGAVLAAAYQRRAGRPPGRRALLAWLAASVAGTVVAVAYLFAVLRADALAMWPNG